RWDNNITRRDVYLQDNATEVQGEPSGWDKFIFWIISGFGSPRNIDAWIQVFYEDLRDGQVKPVPAGVKVEVWDYDPITGDDKLAKGHTVQLRGPDGELTSAVRMTFSTSESGERGPDLYCRVIKPSGAEFAEFIANSFFAAGADHWSSRSQTASEGGFYEEDFSGDRLGIDSPLRLILRPTGIRIQAAFESYSVVNNEFEKLPAGIPVKIMDSNPAAPQPVLATVTTDENGEIRTSLPKREDYHPSIYFLIEKTGDPSLFLLVDYFLDQDRWDSRTKQGEVIASDGSVRTISGHFQNWTQDSLVGANERLRFRLEAPGIQMHLRFEYFDREAGGYRPLPVGTEVEVWEDDAAATQPLVTGTVGQDGRAEIAVPKGGRDRLNLYARVVMRRRLSAGSDAIIPPTVDVRQGGNVIHWDTKGQTATDGTTAGLFTNVEARVPTTGGPLVFRIGTGAADATVEHAAPFILRVIGEAHDWLRTRTNGDWSGVSNLQVELFNSAAEGSKFDSGRTRISLNTDHTAPGAAQPDHWNREIIAHQYGHAVLETLYLDPSRTTVAVPNHRGYNPTDERNPRLAFAEGWADYVANAHKTTPTRPDPSGHGWRGSDGDGTDSSGEIVPIAVANMLYQIDQEIVKQGHTDNSDPVNQRRFLALIWNPIQSLSADANLQVPYQLYRAIQSANLAASDLIPPHDITHIRQEVRHAFEQNGMVFTRGRIQAAAQRSAQNLGAAPPVPEVWRFQVRPVDQARLNVATMGRITAYRIQARRVGTADFVDLDPIVEVPEGDANQRATIDVNLTAARQAAVLSSSGPHDFRVRARDEFGAWDTFADDFTGNTDTHGTGVTSNDTWQRNRLHSIHGAAIHVP
ncbi:MAG: hypothetical protein GXP39_18660, partial [Chloroflexi bacterium]|nr:hypothetical protein [Chloroflexota bacterium]